MELTLKRLLEQAKFTTYKGKGYESAEVDAFLDRAAAMAGKVEVQLTQAMEKASKTGGTAPDPATVEAEIERRVGERLAQRGAGGPGEEEIAEEARRTLVLAQRTADAAIRDARIDAEKLVNDAQERSQSMVAEAEAHARTLRSDNDAALARERNEARQQVAEEITQLEGTRDALSADIEALERHVKGERDKLEGAVSELQSFLDESEGLHPPSVPELNDPEIPDLSPAPVPSSSSDAPTRASAESSSASEEAASASSPDDGDRPSPSASGQGTGSGVEGREGGGSPPPGRGEASPVEPQASASSEGASPGAASPAAGRSSTLTATAEAPDAERPYAPPSLTFGDVDHEAPGVAPPAEAGSSPASPTTVDLRDDDSSSSPADSGDDAFLAELRRAMAEDEPLGPGDDAERGGHPDLYDDDRRSRRFGRRR